MGGLRLIELINATFKYPAAAEPALCDVSLAIDEGEFIGLIGPTGSGKSTLIQLLNGLLLPTQGEVLFRGRRIGKEIGGLDVRREVGLLFQFPESQLFEATVFDDVAFGPRNLGLSAEEVERRVESALKAVGLDPMDFANRSPFSLSGGEMRRIAIAGVLAMRPKVLVLDEPTSGLDARGRSELIDRLTALNAEGLTVVLVTHDMDEIAHIAKRLIVLDKGRVALQGSPADVFSRADEILEMGLDLPVPAAVLRGLKDRGYDVSTQILDAASAVDEIIGAVRRRA